MNKIEIEEEKKQSHKFKIGDIVSFTAEAFFTSCKAAIITHCNGEFVEISLVNGHVFGDSWLDMSDLIAELHPRLITKPVTIIPEEDDEK